MSMLCYQPGELALVVVSCGVPTAGGCQVITQNNKAAGTNPRYIEVTSLNSAPLPSAASIIAQSEIKKIPSTRRSRLLNTPFRTFLFPPQVW